MHRVIGRIPSQDLVEARLHRNPFTGRIDSHVDQGEHVQLIRIRHCEVGELDEESPFFRLEDRSRVVRDERNNPLRNPLSA